MARVLEFKPRTIAPVEPLSAEERLARLRKRTADTIKDLLNYYNSTGQWNKDLCDAHAIRAIEELYALCGILAATEVKHEQPPSIG
jgi:hypothetical protein